MSPLSPLHPRFVHFPIALLLTGSVVGLVYLLGWRRTYLATVTWAMIFLGWLGLFPAILSGLVDQNKAPQDQAVVALLNPHIAVGIALVVVYGLLLYERLRWVDALDRPKRRWWLAILLVLGIGLVIAEGWLGGNLVYGLGIGVQA